MARGKQGASKKINYGTNNKSARALIDWAIDKGWNVSQAKKIAFAIAKKYTTK